MGTLLCKAAKRTGKYSTNEVTPRICFNCDAGRIFRDVGCDAVSPEINIFMTLCGNECDTNGLFCNIRKRNTSLDYCRTCNLVNAETTRNIVSKTRGLFEAQGFYSAYQDLEKARKSIKDGNFENAVTRSISCLESVMKICHEKLEEPLPSKKNVVGLWKSTRDILNFNEFDSSQKTLNLINALSRVATHLGGLRNTLGDAHGKGMYPHDVSESIAELAINTASTLSTVIIRRFNQIKEEKQ